MYTLGLDLGTASIGWALIQHDAHETPQAILAIGTRIFPESVEPKSRLPKNQARRAARLARRQLSRRKRRRAKLQYLLVKHRFLPEDEKAREAILRDNHLYDPYLLRKRALDSRLTLHEIGRVLAHLNQRRGFQSNRRIQFVKLEQDKDIQQLLKDEEDQEVKKKNKSDETEFKRAISELRKLISQAHCHTIGEYLANQPNTLRKRNLITDRNMYKEEFEQIWRAQSQYYPEVMNDTLQVEIFNIIFHQRALKPQKQNVGLCQFEPNRKRAAKALLEFQRYRIWEQVNHLRIVNRLTGVERPLMLKEKQCLVNKLDQKTALTWPAIRKLLNLADHETFSIEQYKEKLIGNRTACTLRAKLGSYWDNLNLLQQQALIADIVNIFSKSALFKRAKEYWQCNVEQAYQLATIELEPGYGQLSRKAILKLTPLLENGLNYAEACKKATYHYFKAPSFDNPSQLALPPDFRNPFVNKALFELRKLIHAIIRVYGRPQLIRIEMARDMKLTQKQKTRLLKQQKNNERSHIQAAQQLYELGCLPSPDPATAKGNDLLKYRLWIESGEKCPYTGHSISPEQLFSEEIDIEHIIPYHLSLDDSYLNKTLCFAAENRQIKFNKTPYEAYVGNPQRYQKILQRIEHMGLMPEAKKCKFRQQTIDQEAFIDRQLNDTRYIARAVRDYLQQLNIPIEMSKGEATAALRHHWQLDAILENLSAANARNGKQRQDHRHHAVDAIVIALTSRKLFHQLSRLSAQSSIPLSKQQFFLSLPWSTFHTELKRHLAQMIVSHAAITKLHGALHEATVYGYCPEDKCFVYRKALNDFKKAKEIAAIRDPIVKQLVEKRIEQYNGNLKLALGNNENPILHIDGKTPIRRIRINAYLRENSAKQLSPSQPGKYFKLGNNHHAEIFEHRSTGKREIIIVSMWEAAQRARRKNSPIVQTYYPEFNDEWRFIMALHPNDMVLAETGPKPGIYRVVKMSAGTQTEITLAPHFLAQPEEYPTLLWRIKYKQATCFLKKISIDQLGRQL